jgi:hypothetical protein
MNLSLLREVVRRLSALLEDPQPGLATWNDFFREAICDFLLVVASSGANLDVLVRMSKLRIEE